MAETLNNSGIILEKKGLEDGLGKKPTLVWNKKVPGTGLEKFKKVVERKHNLKFDSYWDLHKWTIENFPEFWKELWTYFDIIASSQFEKVFSKTGKGFLDNEWFTGASFNFAENLLRFRDDQYALICVDKEGHEETLTFAQLYDEVQRYAAAFRKNGLKAGDCVGCYMSNRKEAVIGMLAATSVGAIWGGPLPFYGPRVAGNILKSMEPKFLLTVDFFQDDGTHVNPIDDIGFITENIPSLKKTIIVVTRTSTLENDLSHIPTGVFLEDFLEEGIPKNGEVPDLIFEQLPFNHPIAINFTSGTSDLPKGVVHSAGTLIAALRDFSLHLNIKKGDRAYNHFPVGWSTWNYTLPTLALGVTQVLFDGYFNYGRKGFNVWSVFSKYRITYALLATSNLDEIDRKGIIPEPGTNLDSLKILDITASPIKPRNYEYVYSNIKKDVFIGSVYGSTEVFGDFTGFDLNSPAYLCECQVPALGVSVECYDEKGHSVFGKRGELVISTPTPSFPLYLWKEKNNQKMKDTYFNKYADVWCLQDYGWINPVTKGIIVLGRSDDVINQDGLSFGAADIYFAIDHIQEIEDYLCVGQNRWNRETRAVLFIKPQKSIPFTEELRLKIIDTIIRELSRFHVPYLILGVPDIPHNLNNKRMESVVRKIINTNEIPEVSNIKNPECLKYFCDIPTILEYNKH